MRDDEESTLHTHEQRAVAADMRTVWVLALGSFATVLLAITASNERRIFLTNLTTNLRPELCPDVRHMDVEVQKGALRVEE